MQSAPVCGSLFLPINKLVHAAQFHFDSAFDRKYGTDTSGVIPLKDLTIKGQNIEQGIWYEPMSEKIFRQLMDHLTIKLSDFEFIDFGSGKGRVLLMASEYGFQKVVGIEFAEELHRIANENIAIYKLYTRRQSNIETFCMDAVEFSIPNVNLVMFFYSPFGGRVMHQVLNNITSSLTTNPRKLILVFYGRSPSSLKLLKATQFQYRELQLHADWSKFTHYRGFLFTNKGNENRDDIV